MAILKIHRQVIEWESQTWIFIVGQNHLCCQFPTYSKKPYNVQTQINRFTLQKSHIFQQQWKHTKSAKNVHCLCHKAVNQTTTASVSCLQFSLPGFRVCLSRCRHKRKNCPTVRAQYPKNISQHKRRVLGSFWNKRLCRHLLRHTRKPGLKTAGRIRMLW